MSWNLWWRFGDWRARHEAILATLRAERPDVCGLQEVWAVRDGEHQAELLAPRARHALGVQSVADARPLALTDRRHGHRRRQRGAEPVADRRHRDRGPRRRGPHRAARPRRRTRRPDSRVHHPPGLQPGRFGGAVRAGRAARTVRCRAPRRGPSAGPHRRLQRRTRLRRGAPHRRAPDRAGGARAGDGRCVAVPRRHANPVGPGTAATRTSPGTGRRTPGSTTSWSGRGAPGAAASNGSIWRGTGPHQGVWPSDHFAVVADLR